MHGLDGGSGPQRGGSTPHYRHGRKQGLLGWRGGGAVSVTPPPPEAAPSAKMKQMPLEIRRELRFPTSCGAARSGRRAAALPEFHGALAHFRASAVRRAGQELGQLSTEATSGADGEICPDNNKVDNKGDKSVPTPT